MLFRSVTARSGQDVKTVNCTVTFQNENNNNNGSLSASCYPSIQTANTNQTITWRVTPSGGNGNYTYSWSGSDNLYGNTSYVSKAYTSAGQKNATVQVYSNGQSVSATCYANVTQAYTYTSSYVPTGSSVSGVYVQPNYIKQGASVSGVYLNDLPATGLSLTWIHYMIAIMTIILAAIVTYVSKNKARFTGITE